jgi:hypothetical protein
VNSFNSISGVRIIFSVVLLSVGSTLNAQTIYVDTINDSVDFSGAQQVTDLPGPGGVTTFREAVIAANNTPGPQTIGFRIPAADISPTSGMATIRVGSSPFNINDDGTVIDGRTQTDFTGDTNPNGNEVGFMNVHPAYLGSYFMFVNSNDNVLRDIGFMYNRGYGISLQGDRNTVTGCYINGPLYAAVHVEGNDNIVGGTIPEDANHLASGNEGVRIEGTATGNRIIGNFLDSAVNGVMIRENAHGNIIGGPTDEERNYIYGSGHTGEHGAPIGAQVNIQSNNNIIQNNYIGVNEFGLAAAQAGDVGIEIRNGQNNLIIDNVIGGITGSQGVQAGIGLWDSGSIGNTIQGNYIGVTPDGDPVPNGMGIAVFAFQFGANPSDVLIGGTQADEGNEIAYNENAGVQVTVAADAITISGNSIHDNGELGITFLGGGQPNAPTIASAEVAGGQLSVSGSLAGNPSQDYVVELFSSTECDPSGFGEGATFSGIVTVTTDAVGLGAFSGTFDIGTEEVITATVTDLFTGNTSEFSACVDASSTGLQMGDMDTDGDVDLVDFANFQLCFTGPGGAVSEGTCSFTDFDGDGDCDLVDFNEFQLSFTGAQ